MKNAFIIVALSAVFVATWAWASDNFLGSIQSVAGVAKCYPDQKPGSKLAVQCKAGACHVAASSQADGGGSSLLGTTADTNSVLVSPGVLYDVDMTTAALPYLCVLGSDGGAVKADVFIKTNL